MQSKIQSEKLSSITLDNRKGKMYHVINEHAIIKDNGLRNDYTLNFKLMKTNVYHARFEGLTKHKALNEALYRHAIKILEHRSGTEYEDLVIIDARTGEFILENTSASGMRKFQCSLSQAQIDKLKSYGKAFEALHNHPNNSFPSPSDIKNLFKRKMQRGSTIVCHNGTVYHLAKLKDFVAIEEFLEGITKATTTTLQGYPEHLIETHISEEIIKRLERAGFLRFKEVPSHETNK